MTVVPLGESAYIIRNLPCAAAAAASQLESLAVPGIRKVVPSFASIGLVVDPLEFDPGSLSESLFDAAPEPVGLVLHEIPVCYDGEDLDEVCEALGLDVAEFISLHSNLDYECRAVGFCPGFPYLGPLPPPLDQLPRRASPRLQVPGGSVAIAAGQTGIYPRVTPGGWWLVGRTPLVIADEKTAHFPIRAGDRVRFIPINDSEFGKRLGTRLERSHA